jgi:hypothetical protein
MEIEKLEKQHRLMSRVGYWFLEPALVLMPGNQRMNFRHACGPFFHWSEYSCAHYHVSTT